MFSIKFLRKFVTSIVLGVFCLSMNLGVLSVSANNFNYITVADTILGKDSIYTIDSSIDISRARLALVSPSKKVTSINSLSRTGVIKSSNLNQAGIYELALGYKVKETYLVIDRTKFEVFNFSFDSSFGIGGDVQLQQANERFRFTSIPTTITPFQTFSLTLEALTPAGTVDTSYVGTVRFSSDDTNAILPENYTFLPADAGRKIFENAFVVSNFGKTSIVATDLANSSLVGEAVIDLGEASGSSNTGGLIEVDTPIAGTQTTSQVVFSGRVDAGLEVEILDNGVFLQRTNADAQGNFSVNSANLPDGDYVFTIRTSNAQSSPIAVTISTAAANVSTVSIDPEKPVVGSTAEVTVNFNDSVDTVSAIVNGIRNPLSPIDNDKRVFRGSIVVPSEPGMYPINLDITTNLGARSQVEGALEFEVVESRGVADDISFFVPSSIAGLTATSQDRRINLSWQPATAAAGIEFYRVFYGTNSNNLSSTVDTNSADTRWYIDNLENGVRYYFQVFGVDTEGNQGDQGSQIVSAIPGVDGSTSLHGIGGGDLVGRTSETGPALYISIIISVLLSSIYFKSKKTV